MARAVFTGTVKLGEFAIPVGIYKSNDRLGLEAHRYHEDCGGKIRMEMYCEEHPHEQPVEFYSALPVNEDTLIRVDKVVKSHLFDRDVGLSVISAHKINILRDAIIDGTVVPSGHYYIKPKFTDNLTADVINDLFRTFLHRLKVKNIFLFVTLPIDGMNRYAAITSGGMLIPFCYDAEIREGYSDDLSSDPVFREVIDHHLEKITSDIFSTHYSATRFFKKIETWLKSAIGGKVNA